MYRDVVIRATRQQHVTPGNTRRRSDTIHHSGRQGVPEGHVQRRGHQAPKKHHIPRYHR